MNGIEERKFQLERGKVENKSFGGEIERSRRDYTDKKRGYGIIVERFGFEKKKLRTLLDLKILINWPA